MTAVIWSYPSDLPSSAIPHPSLVNSGLTNSQAEAIAGLVQQATGDAVDALRHEVARWHFYLAIFLLTQIGIVLLVILMLQAVREPVSPSRPASSSNPGRSMAPVRPGEKW